jgi:RNA polymerase sigma-70 factor (ECF subfamily)
LSTDFSRATSGSRRFSITFPPPGALCNAGLGFRALFIARRLVATSHQPLNDGSTPKGDSSTDLSLANDAALGQALIDGSAEAPVIIWRRFAPLVRRILARSLGPARDIEDTIQDVFLCVFDKGPTLRNPASLRAFIVSVTIRSLRYEIRRRKLRSWLRLPGEPETLDLRSVEIDTDSREALERFYQLLDRINTRDRTAFSLHFIEGMDIREIARAMDVSVPTIRRCLIRARQKLTLFAGRDPILVEYVSNLDRRLEP